MPFPFEVPFDEVEANLDAYVDEVFSRLQSEFLTLPKGPGFIEYPIFENGYEALKMATRNFQDLSPDAVVDAVYAKPISLIVLRCMLGFTPPEWAYVTTNRTDTEVTQAAARSIDRSIRMNPANSLSQNDLTVQRIRALVITACQLLAEGAPRVSPGKIHRLDKADTSDGQPSLQAFADLGLPYPVLLYERFLGRPFAAHRDSVSELIGAVLETAIEKALLQSGVSFRRTGRAERIADFDQAPDFLIPTEFNPQIVIEAKITEDDGTARDKVTRVQHLSGLATEGRPSDQPRFEVVACIAGRGFGVRREDMKKLLLATRGKVFTLENMNQLVEHTRIREFKTK